MAEAVLNGLGLLEPGIHPMTLDEVGQLFGRFQRSDRRCKLMNELRTFVQEVRSADDRIQILIDGSFIMGPVDEPGDIDVLLILPADWDPPPILRPFEYNVVSKRMVKKLHGFDMLVAVEGHDLVATYRDFFGQVNVKWIDPLGIPARTVKGLVRVQP